MPDASSNILLLSSPFSDRICSIIFNSITLYASDPIPVSINRSLISFNRQGVLFRVYSLSPLRYTLRPISMSLYSMGSLPLLLCTVRVTSQTLSGFIFSAPLKITSSIFPPRSTLDFCSPSTHRIASTIFVFPQPFGPTTVVTPSLSFKISFFAKDLKPCIFSSEIYTIYLSVCGVQI